MVLKTPERRDSMKERLTIRKRGQITLPKSIMERFQLKEGDTLDLEMNEHGEIILVPMIQIPASQKWFWTEEWQQGEREADEDIKADRLGKPISNNADLEKYFKELDENIE
ncbi:AbrB/MazE/SpoVT family DNA-binding domain-containing protein [Lederbergia sp. NSJ-179]|uniref:AbrB/MazE/SpoVT family DNA-binding domain-containing protein n=1 Tax=Lederbergia sp. NSJ-179 TaxID=2931402 RepID=UPI001FD16B2A|nr:AbrB/MazE/SpoVT family DNA-binding domain-containing protein [Lederbergia sp. NSJ-179]MCJ7840760.1 AbrB/MazE/SpoVT family DNA-binding domain-containing protein [Lederbergia sp. NSJ-179]